MRFYNLHNKVEVFVDASVSSAVVDTVDFQLNHFRDNKPDAHNDVAKINIRPYSRFKPQNEMRPSIFHEYHFVEKVYCDNIPQRFAALRTPSGFEIFADHPNFLINFYIQLLLLQEGIMMCHAAAAVSPKGEVVLFPGPGGVGKTTILKSLVEEMGFSILGDDIVLVAPEGICYSFPRSFVLKEYHREIYPEAIAKWTKVKPKTLLSKLRYSKAGHEIVQNLPGRGFFNWLVDRMEWREQLQEAIPQPSKSSFLAAAPVADILGTDAVSDSGKLFAVCFLERARVQEFCSHPIQTNDLVNRMESIIHHEWCEQTRHISTMAACGMFDWNLYMTSFRKTFDHAVDPVHRQIIKIPQKATPDDLARYISQAMEKLDFNPSED